jgi:hypothetical protein
METCAKYVAIQHIQCLAEKKTYRDLISFYLSSIICFSNRKNYYNF